MSSWAREFRDFINRGNVVDLAVAVVIGAAFGAVIASFVTDVLTPIIGAIFGQADFSDLVIDIGDAHIFYGRFINAVLAFLSVAFAVFLVVKAYNRMRSPKVEEAAAVTEVELLTEIRDALVRRD
jgi:large conductance mechanosensitive channel